MERLSGHGNQIKQSGISTLTSGLLVNYQEKVSYRNSYTVIPLLTKIPRDPPYRGASELRYNFSKMKWGIFLYLPITVEQLHALD